MRLLILIPLILLATACSFNNNIFLNSEERSILKNNACKGAPVRFTRTAVNEEIVKRWQFLCPLRKITLVDDHNIKSTVVTAARSFEASDQEVHLDPRNGEGVFCTMDPLLQSMTLYIVPLICTHKDTFGPCIKNGNIMRCGKPSLELDSVMYVGWLPIVTHSLPHLLGGIFSDRAEDRIIASIQKELNKFYKGN